MSHGNLTRRRFVASAAQLGAASLLPASVMRAMAYPTPPGGLAGIDHVVILVQENRSFDHYFGTLGGVRNFADPNPIRYPNGKTVFTQPSSSKNDFLPYHTTDAAQCLTDVDHGLTSGQQAWDNGLYDGWWKYKADHALYHYVRANIPFQFALADAFTLCDAYHCSLMSSTLPNRLYLWSGTSGGVYGGSDSRVGADYAWTSFAERLQSNGISWQTYQESDNFGDNALEGFKAFNPTNAPVGSELWNRAQKKSNPGQLVADFKTAIQSGTLPAVSYIVGPAATTEHPSYSTVDGAAFVSSVLDALASQTNVWNKTAVIITFDENGGFMDHVPPPVPPTQPFQAAYTTGELQGSPPTPFGLGARVPTFIVSPWSRGGRVCSETFDHTSVNRFLESWIKVRFAKTIFDDNISKWRRQVCGDLTSAFDFSSAQLGMAPPVYTAPAGDGTSPSSPALPEPPDYSSPNDMNRVLMSPEGSTRVLTPSPQRPAASMSADRANNAVVLTFSNSGSAGCAMSVVVTVPGPLRSQSYVVPPNASVSAPISDSIAITNGYLYDLTVYGPNGFTRRFKGDLSKYDAEVSADDSAGPGQITLRYVNSASVNTPGKPFTSVDIAYRTNTRGYWTTTVAAQSSASDSFGTVDGWYDLTTTIDNDPTFLRSFSGHIESSGMSRTFENGIIPRTVMRVVDRDSEDPAAPASNAVDGNISSIWSTPSTGTPVPMPHFITVDLRGTRFVTGLCYMPRQDAYNGAIAQYEVWTSDSNLAGSWTRRAAGAWPKDYTRKTATFTAGVFVRYVKLVALSEVDGRAWTTAAEVRVLGR